MEGFMESTEPISFKVFDAVEWRNPVLGNIMEALADPNTPLIGVYGSDEEVKETLLDNVCRRVARDGLFDRVLTATITEKPDVKKMQEEVARQLGFTFNHKSKFKWGQELIMKLGLTFNHKSDNERAQELLMRIKNEQKILIILRHLCKGFDLSKVGIPYGSDHIGCKVMCYPVTCIPT